ncbi:MAG: M23 family metallopeptidase, partial [Pseudomonadota bacterium]
MNPRKRTGCPADRPAGRGRGRAPARVAAALLALALPACGGDAADGAPTPLYGPTAVDAASLPPPQEPEAFASLEQTTRDVERRRTEGSYVRVTEGQTLFSLADVYNLPVEDLAQANDLETGESLAAGQTLFVPGRKTHTVQAGDTLYSIATANGEDVETLAMRNGIRAPYTISIGAVLALQVTDGSADPIADAPVRSAAPADDLKPMITVQTASLSDEMPQTSGFAWPVEGPVVSAYGVKTSGLQNEGVNIAAPKGAPVRASASGEVLYQGAELKGYGNLVLVKHEDGWVTTYAHLDEVRVRKGDKVRKGQVIATVGDSGSVEEPQLHFEMRRDLKSIDPQSVLAAR